MKRDQSFCVASLFEIQDLWTTILLLLVSTFSLITKSLTVFVSVLGFFLITISSFTRGSFFILAFSWIKGIRISVLVVFEGGFSNVVVLSSSAVAGGLFSMTISSCIRETSIVFVSVTGSFIIVTSSVKTFFDTLSFSSITGTFISSSSSPSFFSVLMLFSCAA